jgi:hypothetical protein
MRLLFAPVSIAGGLLAGLVAKKAFEATWSHVSDEEPPEPEHRTASWGTLLAALALEGAIFRASRGLVDRASRVGFERMTGSWPGEERPEPS